MAPVALILGLALGLGLLFTTSLVLALVYIKRDKRLASHKRSTSTSGEKGTSTLGSFNVLSFKRLAKGSRHAKSESNESIQPGALGTSASYKELLSAGLTIRLYAQSEIANGVAYIAGTPHSIWDLIQAGVDFERKVVPIADSKGQEIAILIQHESCQAFFATGADVLGDDAMQDIWAPLFHFAGQMKSALGKRTSANVELGANLSKIIGSDTNVLPNSVTSAWIRAGLGTQDRLDNLVPVMQNVVERALENAIALAKSECEHDPTTGERTDIVETMEALTLALVIRCVFGDEVYAKKGGDIANLLRTIRNILCDSITVQSDGSMQELAQYYAAWFQLVEQIILDSILAAEALGRTMKSDSVEKPIDYLGWLTTTLKKNGAPSTYFASLPVHLLIFSLQAHVYLHNILSWMMIDIVGNPSVLTEAQRQASSALAGRQETSPFIDRCLKESYRLHSPALVTRRRLNAEAVHLGPTLIASSLLIAASPYIQNSDPTLFEDAETYLPMRWTNPYPSRPTSPSPAHLRAPKIGQMGGAGTSSESLLSPSLKDAPRLQLSRLRGPSDTFIDFALNVVCTSILARFRLRPRATADGVALGSVDQVFASERGLWCAWPQTNTFFTVEVKDDGLTSQNRSMSAQSLANRRSASQSSFKKLISTPAISHGIEINIKRATVLDPVSETAESELGGDAHVRESGDVDEVDASTAIESVAMLARKVTASSPHSPLRSDFSLSSRHTMDSELNPMTDNLHRYQARATSQMSLSDLEARSIYLTPVPPSEHESHFSKTNSVRSFDDDLAELERQLLSPLSRSGSASSMMPDSPSHSMLSAASSPPMTPISDQRHSVLSDGHQWESDLVRMGVPYIREESSSTLANFQDNEEDVTERGQANNGLLQVGATANPRESVGASSLYTQSSLSYSAISKVSPAPSERDGGEVVFGVACSGSDAGQSRAMTPTSNFTDLDDDDYSLSPATTVKPSTRRPLPQPPVASVTPKRQSMSKRSDVARMSMISQYSEATRFADATEDDVVAMPSHWQWTHPLSAASRDKRNPNMLKIQSALPSQAQNAGVRPVLGDITNRKTSHHNLPLPIIVRSATNESLRRDFTWVGDAVGVRESTYRFSKFYNR